MKDYSFTELKFIETTAAQLLNAAIVAVNASARSTDARRIALRNMASVIFVLTAFVEAEDGPDVVPFPDVQQLGNVAVEEIKRTARAIHSSATALSRSGNGELADHHRRQLFAALFALAPFGPNWKLSRAGSGKSVVDASTGEA